MADIKRKVDAIVFDLDGTLLDTEADIIDSVRATLKNLGLKEKPYNEIKRHIGYGVKHLLINSLGKENENLYDKALEFYTKRYKKDMLKTTKIFDGVIETLEHFKNKKLAVLTNKRASAAQEQLKYFGIDKYFYEVIGGDREECLKPSACPINELIQKHKLSKDKVIVVGDMDVDILAGKAAGNLTCAVTYGIGDKEAVLKAKPDFVIDKITQLKEIIE